jgi:hypothetical protein
VTYTDPLTISDLYLVNVYLVDVVLPGKFGHALGLKPQTCEKIRRCYQHAEQCFTEVLATWLSGRDRPHNVSGPSWTEVVAALESVDMQDFAQQLVLKLSGEHCVIANMDFYVIFLQLKDLMFQQILSLLLMTLN